MSAAKALAPLPERFWSKVEKTNTCWLWSAAITSTGYGVIRIDNRLEKAHRVAYTLHVGPIPAGMQIDHMCHNRACVRPSHLRVVTNQQNQENRSGAQVNNGRSGIRGVYWHGGNGMWRVEVRVRGERHYGGYFQRVEDAAIAATALRRDLMPHSIADQAAAS